MMKIRNYGPDLVKINLNESKYQKWGQNGPKIITLEQNELKMAKMDENKPETGKNIGN